MKRLLETAALVLVAIAVATFGVDAQSAEQKKITYTTKFGPVISRMLTNPGDQPEHELAQTVRTDMTSSSDPDWNDAPVTVYGHSDLIADSGAISGYATRTHKNGDKTYYRYRGNSKAGGASEGTVEVVGGTGKFQNIKGSGTFTSKSGPGGGATVVLEVEY